MTDGFIHALQLDGQGGTNSLTWNEAEALRCEDGRLWLHFDINDRAASDWIRKSSGLDELVSAALTSEETRPRAVSISDGLMVFLRGVNLNPGQDPEDMISIRLWIDRERIISVQRRPLLSVEDLVAALKKSNGPVTPGDFLVKLVERLTARMDGVVDESAGRVEQLEEMSSARGSAELRTEIADIRRQTVRLRRYLAPQREALGKLLTLDSPLLTESDKLCLQETRDNLLRHIEDLDEVRDCAVVAHEELLSRESDETNRRMFLLSMLAAVFMPIGFITGLLGINVGGIPGAENPWAFALVIGLLVGIVVFELAVFGWKKWL